MKYLLSLNSCHALQWSSKTSIYQLCRRSVILIQCSTNWQIPYAFIMCNSIEFFVLFWFGLFFFPQLYFVSYLSAHRVVSVRCLGQVSLQDENTIIHLKFPSVLPSRHWEIWTDYIFVFWEQSRSCHVDWSFVFYRGCSLLPMF